MCGACYDSGIAACIERHWLLPTLAVHVLEHTSGHVQRHGDETAALPSMRRTYRAQPRTPPLFVATPLTDSQLEFGQRTAADLTCWSTSTADFAEILYLKLRPCGQAE